MEFLFDTANLAQIEQYSQYFPITGVTSNPSILKQEGNMDLFSHMRRVREVIGIERTLHIQVVAEDAENIIKEAHVILDNVDDQVYIKIPTTEQGLKAMRQLKTEGVHITATAVYSKIQGFMAILSGADYIAPYYNRMENLDIHSEGMIAAFRKVIDESGSSTKILAASFKNMAQVTDALLAGAHAVTVSPILLHEDFGMATIKKAIDDFHADWVKTQGDTSNLE